LTLEQEINQFLQDIKSNIEKSSIRNFLVELGHDGCLSFMPICPYCNEGKERFSFEVTSELEDHMKNFFSVERWDVALYKFLEANIQYENIRFDVWWYKYLPAEYGCSCDLDDFF
jgi:hypothetical protein